MPERNRPFSGYWGIILGGSSGFGLAAVQKLALHGMNLAVLYREMSSGDRVILERFRDLAAANQVRIAPFNLNALDSSGRDAFLKQFKGLIREEEKVKLLLHSISRGNLKPLTHESDADDGNSGPILSIQDIQVTTYAMSTSLLDWCRMLLDAGLFCRDGRVIGLTSEGAHRYWKGYAAVSMAKASLESLTSYLAVELGKWGIRVNLIQAGVTDTPSLKWIPESDLLLSHAAQRNPCGRLTQPEDVAGVIFLLCLNEASWINGSLIPVDGGEHCC